MSSKNGKYWRTPLIVLCFLAAIVAWLAFGEQGLIRLYRTEMERQSHMEKIHKLAEENQALLDEIHRLRTDMKYVEAVVRKELHLVKENEVIYRFKRDKTPERGAGNIPRRGQTVD